MNPAATRVRQALRSRIDGERILSTIEDVQQRLLSGWEQDRNPATGEVTWVPLSASRVSALSTVLATQLSLLKKLVPDIKAVELSGEEGAPLPLGASDNLVLATKLLALMRSQGDRQPVTIEGEASYDFLQ